MDYIKEYKSFINSYYLSEGIRITVGLTLPAVLFSYLGNPSAGIIISLGASCVIMVDNAGPIHHRRNAMMVCDVLIFVVALVVGYATQSQVLLGLCILLICFISSMIGVFGSRASSIGLAAMFVMVLNIDRGNQGWQVLLNAGYVFAGGVWYTLLSLMLYSFRPYKLAQQALGDCIEATSEYLRTRAAFYSRDVDYEKNYGRLLKEQVSVHEKQDLVRELLFKSRNIVKDSTHIGRVLVMIFIDIVDLFERVITSHQDYEALHNYSKESDILQQYHEVLLTIADDLNDIGIAIKSGRPSLDAGLVNANIKALKASFIQFRDKNRTAANVEGFISLRNILDNIEDIGDRLHILHNYTTYDRQLAKAPDQQYDYEQFTTHQDIDPRLLLDHLNLQSNTFRHALRVSIATLTGYVVSTFFPFGHSYWILLTIIVILKPAYSLTKKRNYDRLLGTIAGAAIGLLVIYFVKERDGIFISMIIFMIGAYSFMRTRYLVFVLLMTPYILLLFYLLNPHDFRTVIMDRVIDTGIGSVIAFLANSFVFPAWEHEQISDYLINIISANSQYFRNVANAFAGKPSSLNEFKLSRKQAFVSLANLSDAFNRMISEPKSRQKNIRELNQFVVLNQMFTSHIATLSSYTQVIPAVSLSANYQQIVNSILQKLDQSKAVLTHQAVTAMPVNAKEGLRVINDQINGLIEQRKAELEQGITESETRKKLSWFKPVVDQFNFISKIAADLEKTSLALAAVVK